MEKIVKKSGVIFLIVMMLLPLQAVAAGQDAVTLTQEEDKVEVLLEMSNASEERITAISVSLKMDEGSRDKVSVSFDFSQGLSGAEKDFLYDESTGILNIYAASSRSLFEEEALKLGYVQIQPKEPSQVISVEISYHGASFRTANGSYGSKIPMVARISEPVYMQVGQGVVYDVATDRLEEYLEWAEGCRQENYSEESWESLQQTILEARELMKKEDLTQREVNDMAQRLYQMMRKTLSGGGNMEDGVGDGGASDLWPAGPGTTGSGQGNGNGQQGSGSGEGNVGDSGNINQGLYDDSTVFVHDSAEVQNISSPVVRGKETDGGLTDLSQGTAAQIGGRPSGQGSGNSPVKARVSVVAPENGPASIHVAGAGASSGSGADGQGDGLDAAGAAADLSGQDGAGEEEGQEILLDQKNGGAQKGSGKKINTSLLLYGAVAAAAVGLGAGIFLIVRRKSTGADAAGRKKKKHAKRKRTTGGKKPAERKRPAGKKKPVRKKKKRIEKQTGR